MSAARHNGSCAQRQLSSRWVMTLLAVLLSPAAWGPCAAQQTPLAGGTQASSVTQSILSIQVNVSLRPGYPQPVARTTFYLVDDSLARILRSAGVTIKGRDGKDKLAQTEDDYAIWFGFGANNLRMLPIGDFYEKAMSTLRPHILQTVITDFDGKARFAPVRQGAYFVLGVARTPKGFAVWQLSVPLNTPAVALTLDERNAVVVQ